jgi:hypothetical protein
MVFHELQQRELSIRMRAVEDRGSKGNDVPGRSKNGKIALPFNFSSVLTHFSIPVWLLSFSVSHIAASAFRFLPCLSVFFSSCCSIRKHSLGNAMYKAGKINSAAKQYDKVHCTPLSFLHHITSLFSFFLSSFLACVISYEMLTFAFIFCFGFSACGCAQAVELLGFVESPSSSEKKEADAVLAPVLKNLAM